VNIVFHLTSAPPQIAETDAVFQEVEWLRGRFGGQTINLFPLKHPTRLYPPCLYGIHAASRLRKLDAEADLHHVFHFRLDPFPILWTLKRPVVYTVVAGLQGQRRPRPSALASVRHVVVSNERDRQVLESWGISEHTLIRPGIDVGRFHPAPPDSGSGFRLLAGSAPWVRAQFRQKGIDALLEVVRRTQDLRLVLLWRGLLYDELMRRIERSGVADRVEVLNERVDVDAVLARVHAAVVLAETPKLVKAYPHSLLESLAAGKPVLVSEAIPMADYVRATGCGEVAAEVTPEALAPAIKRLRDAYPQRRECALNSGRCDFARERMLDSYGEVYRAL